MNTTAKKTHIYAVEVSSTNTPLIKVFVRAESKSQARAAIANTMIVVERATQDDLLDVKREDIIDGTRAVAPEQQQLPIEPDQRFGVGFIESITAPEPTAAEQMENGNDAAE